MSKYNTPPIKRKVIYAKNLRDGRLGFHFRGISKKNATRLFSGLKNLNEVCQVTIDNTPNALNGKSCYDVVVKFTKSHSKIMSDEEWRLMIFRILKKIKTCEITFIRDIENYLNV